MTDSKNMATHSDRFMWFQLQKFVQLGYIEKDVNVKQSSESTHTPQYAATSHVDDIFPEGVLDYLFAQSEVHLQTVTYDDMNVNNFLTSHHANEMSYEESHKNFVSRFIYY